MAGATRPLRTHQTDPASVSASQAAVPSVFQALLRRSEKSAASAPLPVAAKAEGIAIGVLRRVDDRGGVWVDIASLGLQQVVAASMVPLGVQNIGQSLALGFEGADTQRPVVLGLMMHATAETTAQGNSPSSDSAVRVTQNGRKVVIEAQTELELRCGDAVILLSEDGHIQIRGAYVTSHASASQRIRGGSVQIN